MVWGRTASSHTYWSFFKTCHLSVLILSTEKRHIDEESFDTDADWATGLCVRSLHREEGGRQVGDISAISTAFSLHGKTGATLSCMSVLYVVSACHVCPRRPELAQLKILLEFKQGSDLFSETVQRCAHVPQPGLPSLSHSRPASWRTGLCHLPCQYRFK